MILLYKCSWMFRAYLYFYLNNMINKTLPEKDKNLAQKTTNTQAHVFFRIRKHMLVHVFVFFSSFVYVAYKYVY